MILGAALVLATAATVYTQSAFALNVSGGGANGGDGGRGGSATGGSGDNGIIGGPCSNSNVDTHNSNCGSGPTGAQHVFSGQTN